MASELKDKRFAHLSKDPKFRRVPKSEKKIKVDQRFNSMFKDKRFKLKYAVDKRGRPVSFTTTEQLKNYYDIDSDNSDGDQEERLPKSSKVKSTSSNFTVTDLDESDSSPESTDTELPEDVHAKLQDMNVDYARGEGALFSQSSSDESSSEDEGEGVEETLVHDWGELDKDADFTEEVTQRLAVCNMDWDRIRAMDLMVLLQSFAPTGGAVKCVTIYPSEFGLERMREEEILGPKELISGSEKVDAALNGDAEEGDAYHREKLRQYQLNRLKYYYAVVECDTVETASKIYEECDGHEFESSAARLDLRFIPEDMTFDQKPKDVCNTLPDVSQYEPRHFMTSALQQAEVHLTWDETNPEREMMIQKLFQANKSSKKKEIDENEIKGLLATSSSEEEEEDEDDTNRMTDDKSQSSAISKYRQLLAEIETKEDKKKGSKDMEMEFTWEVGLQEKAQQLIRKKLADHSADTVWEQQLAKRREKKKMKRLLKNESERREEEEDDIPSDVDLNDPYFREEFQSEEFRHSKKTRKDPVVESVEKPENDAAELELLLMDEKEEGKHHFSLKSIMEQQATGKKKKKKTKADDSGKHDKDSNNFQIQVEDPRFSALFTSHYFNVDPSDPNFKKTPGMEAILKEKQKRRMEQDNTPQQQVTVEKKPKTQDAELSRLIRSVKSKIVNSKMK